VSRRASLPRATPESQGVTSAGSLEFIDALDRLEHVHSVMVLRHGHVIAEGWWAPYQAERPHALFSISKSFTSTAIGLLVEERRLSLDDRVVDLLRDDAPSTVDDRLAALQVRHLLSMSTGQALDGLETADGVDGWARRILGVPVTHDPGTRFMYQTGATYLLAAIATRLTGERLLDQLTPRLLEPLGIDGATWERSPDGIDAGGFGLSMTTEDIAAFGQLLLQRGWWQGRSLVPSTWRRPQPRRSFPTVIPRSQATGRRAMASSSGAGGTTASAPMARSASCA
jgi:CubicO group peptidase (beta-lactamase class C family)